MRDEGGRNTGGRSVKEDVDEEEEEEEGREGEDEIQGGKFRYERRAFDCGSKHADTITGG